MINKGVAKVVGLLALACAGCSDSHPNALPTHEQAYALVPAQAVGYAPGAIQPGDRLSIQVLGEPDLTSEYYVVDENGNLQLPLVGDVVAGGRNTGEVRGEIARRLGERYLRNPQVAISVVEHQKDSVTVEGDVKQAGRFAATPGLTLLGALALAQSPNITAKHHDIFVYRKLRGVRMGARFNLAEVRDGRAADPQIIAGDIVVVGHSALRQAWLDILQTAPLFNIWYVFK